MALWLPRNLTPYGKIKSNAIQNHTHPVVSSQPKTFHHTKFRQKKVQRFLWEDKPPKFKQSIFENVKELGVLQLTNILLFDKALKLSWLRRVCNQMEGWASFPHYYKIDKAMFYGSIYIDNIEKIWKILFGLMIFKQ